jgi:pepF/M3 family oligoendopeptidase
MPNGTDAPRWSLDSIYAGFDAPEYRRALADLEAATAALLALASGPPPETPEALLDLLAASDRAGSIAATLRAYTGAAYTGDTRDSRALAELNALEAALLPLKRAETLFRRQALRCADALPRLAHDPRLAPYAFILAEAAQAARFQLPPDMEDLAADLARSGGDAWGRLHEAVSANASAVWDERTGERKTVTELRSLASDPRREVREKAFRTELAVWRSLEIPLAAALNGVKGAAAALDGRRGWSSALAKSAFQSRIGEKTLAALIAALEASLPLFRRYLERKARILGLERCAFYDLFAPIGNRSRTWRWEEAAAFIPERFDAFDPEMGAFARRVFASGWIDAEPRAGKVGGAYCEDFPLAGETRILCNFDGSFDAVCTVAHELGHAWHYELVKDQPFSLTRYPMTLAETASIFAETLLFEGALEAAAPEERPALLESSLKDACQVTVDILSRFYFERALFEERSRSEVPPERLCELMLEAQTRTYGPALSLHHPYMWAVKGHYYNPSLAFYNYPYAFGQLFSLSLYAKARESGGFAPAFHALLRASGRCAAEEAARSAGFDIERESFWLRALSPLAARLEALEAALLTRSFDAPLVRRSCPALF